MKQNLSIFIFFIVIFFCVNEGLNAGSLCMGPLPGQNKKYVTEPIMSQSDLYIPPTAVLEIQIKDKSMVVSPKRGGSIKDLPNGEKHLVSIKYKGKWFQSFWLDFKEAGSNDLCLWYYRGYGTIMLYPSSFTECNCYEGR